MERVIEDFIKEVKGELEGDILPFWLSLKDPSGGFYGEVSSNGVVQKDSPRGEILNARIIWSFAAAYKALGNPEYIAASLWARDWFVANIIDPAFGGVFWSVASDGAPLDTKKQLYSQAFAIYAFSELYKVTSNEADLEVAVNLFNIIEKRFRDSANGGYVEALSRDFSPLEDMSLSAHDINAGKTMNSHLHLLEAYANLYSVWPDPSLKDALGELIHLMCEKITAPDGHLHLYFENDWKVIPGAVSYGHDIETSWLLLECAEATGDPSLIEYVRPYCLSLGRAGNEGILPDGSMAYELHTDGASDLSRQWWVQAETVVGNIWLWKYHSDSEGLPRAISCWNWIKTHLLCHSERSEESVTDVAARAAAVSLRSAPYPGKCSPAALLPACHSERSEESVADVAAMAAAVSLRSAPYPGKCSPAAPLPACHSERSEESATDASARAAAVSLRSAPYPGKCSPAAPLPLCVAGEILQHEWYWGTLADGKTPDTDNPKAGFWKCPYHNTRMCLEVLRQLCCE